jgi:hypothetical protein
MGYQALPALNDGHLRRTDRSLAIPQFFASFTRTIALDKNAHLLGFSGANCVIGTLTLWVLHALGYFGSWASPSPFGAIPVVLGGILMAVGLRLLSKSLRRTSPLL